MAMERTKGKLSAQMKKSVETPEPEKKKYDGNTEMSVSTGSLLLDLAISGGRKRGGGLFGGTYVEAFGPEGSGKTVLLSEVAGNIQRHKGDTAFKDPEGRLNASFASIFGFSMDEEKYSKPNTVSKVFQEIYNWQPKPEKSRALNGIFVDSLAALSTDLEMENPEGDKMGQRRAKEFSEGFRKTCRKLSDNDWILLCSNQVRDTGNAYGKATDSPGGWAIKFYASVRLEFKIVKKIIRTIKVAGKEIKRPIGIEVLISVVKNSCWKPYRTATVSIIFDYGIDDIRENLQYIKDYTKNTTYTVGGESLGIELDKAIQKVEEQGLTKQLKEEVIDLWESIESQFETERKRKERD